jgi:DNA polymerase (family X)
MHRAEALIEHSIATLRKTRPELKRLSVAGDFRRGCELVDDFAGGRGTVAGRAGRQRGRPKGTSYLTNRRHFGRSWS